MTNEEIATMLIAMPIDDQAYLMNLLEKDISLKIKPTTIKEVLLEDMQSFLAMKGIILSVNPQDGEYYIADWNFYQNLLPHSWWDETKRIWILDRDDCDKRAFEFCHIMSKDWGLNSILKTQGTVEFNEGPTGHAWTFIIALDENGTMQVYFYDPTYNSWSETPFTKVGLGSTLDIGQTHYDLQPYAQFI